LHPFSINSTLLAKHAQHVVLIHFLVALFITSVAFDFLSSRLHRPALKTAAYLNLLIAATSTLPVIVSGLLAWQWQLECQKLKGILFLQLVLALVSTCLIWSLLWLHTRARRQQKFRYARIHSSCGVCSSHHLGVHGSFGRLLKRSERVSTEWLRVSYFSVVIS
jgi:uncharacterized membrane protein